ncbi:hypothetical protein [Synechococcus sp. CCY 0621]|uniref:hypothetical protein n=1 Tax=Synechococcus sp. CCY 0621 TaxID=2815603 RepID=UPI00336A4817
MRVLNGGTPEGSDWHRRLLDRMAITLTNWMRIGCACCSSGRLPFAGGDRGGTCALPGMAGGTAYCRRRAV